MINETAKERLTRFRSAWGPEKLSSRAAFSDELYDVIAAHENEAVLRLRGSINRMEAMIQKLVDAKSQNAPMPSTYGYQGVYMGHVCGPQDPRSADAQQAISKYGERK